MYVVRFNFVRFQKIIMKLSVFFFYEIKFDPNYLKKYIYLYLVKLTQPSCVVSVYENNLWFFYNLFSTYLYKLSKIDKSCLILFYLLFLLFLSFVINIVIYTKYFKYLYKKWS